MGTSENSSTTTLTEALASFGAGLQLPDVPGEVLEKAKVCALDTLGMAVVGYDLPGATVARKTILQRPTPGGATIWMSGEKVSPLDSVLPNSVAAHGFLQDDWEPVSHAHIGVAVIPTTFGLAEEIGSSGIETLMAIVLGYETAARCGVVSVPAFTRGFRASSLYGGFGAAAVASRLLKLDARAYAQTLNAAGSFGGGVLQPWVDGGMEWSYQEGIASRNAILSAGLAANGLHGSRNILEGPSGFNKSFSGTIEGSEATIAELGTKWLILGNCFKRFATGGANQGSAAVAWALKQRHGVDHQAIERVDVDIPDVGTHERMNYAGIPYQGPYHTLDQCLISKPFAIACLLKTGRLDLPTVRAHQDDAEIVDLSHRIALREVKDLNGWELRMKIRLKDGTELAGDGGDIDHQHLYLDSKRCRDKFIGQTSERLGIGRAEQMADLVLRMEELQDIRGITALLQRE